MMVSVSKPVPDLTTCDREPITFLDRIQNFGFLVALANDWTVIRASANLDIYLGIEALAAIGGNFARVVDGAALEMIRKRVALLYASGNERLFGVRLAERQPLFDLNLHFVQDILIIEGERSVRGDADNDTASMVRSMLAQLGKSPDLDAFQRTAARQVRTITGFDRVMVYRFDQDGNGEVVAESTAPQIESFLGLHYPASDIPQQARALYLRNSFRIISDVGEVPVPLLPAVTALVPPLDLSQAITRAVSPVHIEYLTNMGVDATLSISIVVEGTLWGLIACHHYKPRLPSFVMRTAAELFGSMYSLALESRLSREANLLDSRSRFLTDQLIAGIAANEDLLSDLEWLNAMLGEMIDYDGIAIYRADRVLSLGHTPSDAAITTLAQGLTLTSPNRVFTTDNLQSIYALDAPDAATAAGVLAVPISRTPRDYILLFRREYLQSIKWGGEPTKISTTEDSARMSPRKSFEAFSETIRGKCRPFSKEDYSVGEALRAAVVEVILHLSALKIQALAAEVEARRDVEREVLGLNEQFEVRVSKRTRKLLSSNHLLEEQILAGNAKIEAGETMLLDSEGANKKLREANDNLQRFTSIVAHDLRAPLLRVESFVGFLVDDHSSRLNEDGQDLVVRLNAGVARMRKMLTSLLEYSKAGHKAVRGQTATLAGVVESALMDLDLDPEIVEVQVDLGDVDEVAGDAQLLSHVFHNLVGNAVKFRRADTGVVINIQARRLSHNVVEISILDNGIGIEPRFADKVFDMLYRLHSEDEYEGTGIGLSVCRKIVEDHGGQIWIDQATTGGTRVVVTLPARDEQVREATVTSD